MSRKPFQKLVNKSSRRLHRWGAIIASIPILVVIATGIILQLKKDWSWVQPPTAKGRGGDPTISFAQILEAAASVPDINISSWEHIDRLDVRPSKGVVKVRGKNRWEVQIDSVTAEVLQVEFRRSDLIESIHDGSWFHDKAKLWIFLPSAVVLLGLWLTGLYLWVLPIWAKRAGRKRRSA